MLWVGSVNCQVLAPDKNYLQLFTSAYLQWKHSNNTVGKYGAPF